MQSRDFGIQVYEAVRGLRPLAFRLCGNADRADDLMQDTIVKALRYQHQFQPGTNLIGWLVVIMRRTFLSQLRVKNRTVPLDEAAPDYMPHPYEHRTAEDRIELRQRLAAMPGLGREIVLDVAVRGLTYNEAATKYDVCVETIKSRVLRTRRGEYRAGDRTLWRRKRNADLTVEN